ncbi:MAG: methylcrotonoyl-CoA carboxylase [Candidatus Schekmanbacteria bacterium]|nr:methylcrotonoyl-CoA carboxylase [Candidatus Schekmanbacteria bacterium]
MAVLISNINARSAEFRENEAHYRDVLGLLRERSRLIRKGGPPRAHEVHQQRGKLFVRERVARLLDPDTPFLELSALAAWDMHDGAVPCAGIVTGIGSVSGRQCVIVANDATVKGGTYFPETIKKHIRAQEISCENHVPTIYLVDSGGVFLPMQSEVFPDKEHFGNIFYNQAILSARSIPQVAVVMGMCTAGGAYVPAMCDENVIVQGTGTIYLAGPPLVKAATGEEVSEEELGGGAMHSRISGVTDHLAKDDQHAIEIARSIVAHLNTVKRVELDLAAPEDPLYPAEELYGILPKDPRRPYEVTEVIARLVDGSRFHEFKGEFGKTLVCGFAHWMGYPVGIVANRGVLFSESAQKGAHFVSLCARRKVPLVFMQNITGFMVGRRYEEGGITKDGAKMVQAVATAAVPKITIIIGASHGAGNYAMCGRGYKPRFLFTWPGSRISVMGAEQAAQVLVTVKREQLARSGKALTAKEEEEIRRPILEKYEREGSPYYATARLWDDGICDPGETRTVVALALSTCLNAPISETAFPVFRM